MLCLLAPRLATRAPSRTPRVLLWTLVMLARPLPAQPPVSTPVPTPATTASPPTTSSSSGSTSAPPSPSSAADSPRLTPSRATICASSDVALLGVSDAPDGRIVVLRFAPACATGGLPAGAVALAGADTSALARLSPTLEAALAAKHAGAAAQGAVQAAKPSRRETFIALATAVAVLLLK